MILNLGLDIVHEASMQIYSIIMTNNGYISTLNLVEEVLLSYLDDHMLLVSRGCYAPN